MTSFPHVLHLYALKLIVSLLCTLLFKCPYVCVFCSGLCIHKRLVKSLTRIKGGWGWRLSLGLGGIPAVLLTIGSLLVLDTPHSII